ncbi:MAG: hypothetical protein J6V34_02955, partial [Oscillospiraceae bacterium]|nr:hypothetical protein [Oscillospiraceae bacterium]
CTVLAAQRFVAHKPKTFRMQDDAQFPRQPYNQRQCNQAVRIKPENKHHRRKHHDMVPVKNPARGTTAVFQKKKFGFV